MISALISTFALGLSMFAAYLLASRVSFSNVYRPLALCFAANSVALVCLIGRELVSFDSSFISLSELTLLKLVAELILPPLFWIYVRELTSEHGFGFRRSDFMHFTFPLLPSMVVAIICFILFPDNSHSGAVSLAAYVIELNKVLNIVALAQFCFYVYLVMRRLVAYRNKLMDLFSSTENLEMKWFRTILFLLLLGIGLELTAEVIFAMSRAPNPFSPWNDLLRLIIVWSLAVWGLRQLPNLRVDDSDTGDDIQVLSKYEKSSIPLELLSDVSTKIKDFLVLQNGYRDPDLSLRTLSEKISVRSDYITQTLTREIGVSFFDFVNRLRVEKSMSLLRDTDNTVLAISEEVGFNSRSSFYKAFKKIAGCTPTAYRNNMVEGS